MYGKMSLSLIIMAAGKGTRMRSRLPKVLQPLAGKALLQHVLEAGLTLKPTQIIVVYGYGGDQVQAHFADFDTAGVSLQWVEQAEQHGTGHAVQMALPVLATEGKTLILSGDVPLVQPDTLQRLVAAASSGMALLTQTLPDATGYGRILRDETGQISGIVEQKDANPVQQAIREINAGIYCVDNALLHQYLPRLRNDNAQQEFYLTDIVGMAVADHIRIGTVTPAGQYEPEGVNDRQQLAALERRWQLVQAQRLMQQGVHLLDPARFDLRGSLTCGQDVQIDINVIIEGRCTLGDGVMIGAGCILRDVSVAAGTRIAPYSLLDGAELGRDNRIGPFARLRPGTQLADGVHIGNFVEIKNTRLGAGSKANHLAYVGDAIVGSNSNLGAGMITCNYDGANKHRTVIGDQAFIGSNASLVAPVEIGDGATVGAGSVITKVVEPGALGVARGRQVNLPDYVRPVKGK